MLTKELNAHIEYYPDVEIYKVILTDFKINGNYPVIHLKPEEVPKKYADQSPLFKIGDLIDRVYDSDDGGYYGGPNGHFREFYGRITDIETRKFNNRSPQRVFYYTDIWTRQRSNGIPQQGLQLSLNPHID